SRQRRCLPDFFPLPKAGHAGFTIAARQWKLAAGRHSQSWFSKTILIARGLSMQDKLIATFSQVGVMQPLVGRSAAATQGACHNFTIEWVSFMFADKGVVSDAAAAQRMTKL